MATRMLIMLRRIVLALLISLSVGMLPASIAHADMTKSKAAAIAKSKHGGKVLSVEKIPPKQPGGKATYRVRLDVNGRIKTVTIRG